MRRAVIYSGRILTAAAFVAIGLWAVAGLLRWVGYLPLPANRLETPASDAEPPNPEWSLPLQQLSGGTWTVAGFPWSLAVRRVPRARVDDDELLRLPAVTGPARRAPTELEAELFTTAKSLAPKKVTQGGFAVYLVSLGSLRAALFAAPTSAGERLAFVRAAYPDLDGGLNLLEAVPLPGEPPGNGQRASDLLPLPMGSRRVATRYDDRGAVLAELTLTDAEPVALGRLWDQEGYHTGVVADPHVYGVTCWCEHRGVHVWMWPRAGGKAQTLLLEVRLTEVTR
jgi:hypothetical protein